MHLEPFDLFGFQHLLTLSIAAVVIFSVSFYFRNKKNDTKYTAGIAIAVLLVVQVIDGILNTFTFNIPSLCSRPKLDVCQGQPDTDK